MTDHGARLYAFLDGTLSADERVAFEHHVTRCPACQAALETEMQLDALGDELAQRPERPVAAPRPTSTYYQRAAWLSALAACACALALYLWPARPPHDRIALSAHRALPERLPYAALDVYRTYNPLRSSAPAGEPIGLDDLARLERAHAWPQVASAYLARGDLGAAAQVLDRGPDPGDDDLEIARAVLLARQGQLEAALTRVDRVLDHAPAQPQATWNRALILVELHLPLTAAEAFDRATAAAANQGQLGWAAEAMARALALRDAEAARAGAWRRVRATCGALERGVVPAPQIARRYPSACRPALAEAIRIATTRAELEALRPIAAAIDDAWGEHAVTGQIDRLLAGDLAARRAAVALYRQLTATGPLSAADRAGLLARLRATHQADLVMGALSRGGLLADHLAEYVQLARTLDDPYYAEVATEREAAAQVAAGNPVGAELMLREATARCVDLEVERRCSYLHLALAKLYRERHRPLEARATALAALARSRRLGLFWDERLLFNLVADAAYLARDHAVMRAYVREAALRDRECAQDRLSHEVIAAVELDELRFARARAELASAPTCHETATLERARVEAELARIDGTTESIVAARDAFARIRREDRISLAEHAYLTALEGRLVAPVDPVAAHHLVGDAIGEADRLGVDDARASKARVHAYKTALFLDADGDPAQLLTTLARAARATLRPGCVLGAVIDGERLLVIVRDTRGGVTRLLQLHAIDRPDFDPSRVVPRAAIEQLEGCARIDVVTLPPLYGAPRLLPARLAWSYRGPGGAPLAAPDRPTVLVIEDAHPPAALGLPKLPRTWVRPNGLALQENVVRGDEATPARVRRELATADFVEIHAHGFVDLGLSEVSLIALSPQPDGAFALTARAIAGMRLPRAPFVVLGACETATTAPYLHEPWSLPYAFLVAGARGVIAPSTPIPNEEAGELFRTVGASLLRGLDPAVIVRDERLRDRDARAAWVDGLVVFD